MDEPRENTCLERISEAHRIAATGDFKRARQLLESAFASAPEADRTRLRAALESFRLDRAALAVVLLTGVALIVVIALTLFH